jgi:hypothetical protein
VSEPDLRSLIDDERSALLDTVGWLASMDEEQFHRTVVEDLKGRADEALSRALKNRKLRQRRLAVLDFLRTDVSRQLQEMDRTREDYAIWRRGAERFILTVKAAQKEANVRAALDTGRTRDHENGISRQRLKSEFGAVASTRLIDAHKHEFTMLLAGEYARAGVEVPDAVYQGLRQALGRVGEPRDPDGCDPDHAADEWTREYYDVVEWDEEDEEWVVCGYQLEAQEAADKARTRNRMGGKRCKPVQVYEYIRYIEVEDEDG